MTCLAVSPDNTRVASSSGQIWDVASGRETGSLKLGGFSSVCFAANGNRIITGDADGKIRVYDAGTRQEQRSWPAHTKPIRGVASSRDGSQVATAGEDGVLRVWDTRSQKLVHEFANHKAPLLCVAFSPDGRRLVSGSSDQKIISLGYSNRAEAAHADRAYGSCEQRDVYARRKTNRFRRFRQNRAHLECGIWQGTSHPG